MRWLLKVGIIGLVVISGWSREILIATAANTGYIMPKLIALFKKSHPDAILKPVLGSSGKLTAQIRFGAPYQIFISADMGYPLQLYREGIGSEPPKVYAYGILAIVTKKGLNPTLDSLLKSRWIAIANPRLAPYGKGAISFLKREGIYQKVQSKIVYSENVAGVISYLIAGSADAGITALSLLHSPKLLKGRIVYYKPVPPNRYPPIPQGVLLLKGASPIAREFYQFLFTPTAQKVFKQFGYRPISPTSLHSQNRLSKKGNGLEKGKGNE